MRAIRLALCFALYVTALASQAPEITQYDINDNAYGVAYDGTNFWYVDVKRRAIYKLTPQGTREVFNLNLPKLSGIQFDSREGRLYLAADRMILKIEPNTGGVVERIPVPISNIGGVSSVNGIIYILNSDTGKISIYDKFSSMITGGFLTDRSQPKDVSFGRDSLWVSDSQDGSIYRYDLISGKITGSLKTPARDIRGIVFSGSRLWIVDKGSNKLRSMSFIETDRFLASGESDYKVEVTLNFSLPGDSVADGEIAVLYPPTTEHQRIRTVEFEKPGFISGLIKDNRAVIKKLSFDDAKGSQSLKYSFNAKTQNVRYYIRDEFLNKKELFSEDLKTFQTKPEAALGKDERYFIDKFYDARLYENNFKSFFESLLSKGFPVRPVKSILYKENDYTIKNTGLAFLKSYGWTPVSELKLQTGETSRNFSKSEDQIDLFQSTNFEILDSPIFFRSNEKSEWKNISSKITLSIKLISQSQ